MDSALRRYFLRQLEQDFCKLDLREWGVRLMDPEPSGPRFWPVLASWWKEATA